LKADWLFRRLCWRGDARSLDPNTRISAIRLNAMGHASMGKHGKSATPLRFWAKVADQGPDFGWAVANLGSVILF
jgi:hypothetical protein